MPEQAAVPTIVLTRQQDHVEAINSTLRNAGHAVHCSWIREVVDLGDALAQIQPELLLAFVADVATEGAQVLEVVKATGSRLAVLFVRDDVDETAIAEAMQLGARDVVTLANRERLKAVVSRELAAHRLERAFEGTLAAARQYREQLQAFLAGSADAIARVQEGIVVEANPAWLELFGYANDDALVGQPLMDLFEPGAKATLKGALVACLQGKWPAEPLRINGLVNDGTSVPLAIELSRTEFDGEPAVQLSIEARRHDERALDQQLTDAVERDATTGFLQRRYFLSRLGETVKSSLKGGVRQIAALQPDKFAALEVELGPLAIDEFMAQLAQLMREQLQPGDLGGRFADGVLVFMLERGAPRDVEAWASGVIRRLSQHIFRVGEKSVTVSGSVGIGLVDPHAHDPQATLIDALRARRRAEEAGGNRVIIIDHAEDDTRRLAADKVWVQQIKSALMANRFRLVQQPIASLLGEDRRIFDVVVRMLDEQGSEVLPSEFIAAAERNDLMKNIDRWVIGAAFRFTTSRDVERLFIRLSRESVRDKSLSQWLETQLRTARVDAQRIVFEISESVATQQLADVCELATALRKTGFGFAVEHFGTGRDPVQLLTRVPMDFVKVDGSLMQGLAADPATQERVKEFVDVARERSIATIAERVEDANTMAVLWQLGIEFIQGYFVHEPEEVVMG